MLTPTKLILILIIVLLLFGRGKVSDLMGDFAKGIKNFKKGLQDDGIAEDEVQPAVTTIDARGDNTVTAHPVKRKTSAARSGKSEA